MDTNHVDPWWKTKLFTKQNHFKAVTVFYRIALVKISFLLFMFALNKYIVKKRETVGRKNQQRNIFVCSLFRLTLFIFAQERIYRICDILPFDFLWHSHSSMFRNSESLCFKRSNQTASVSYIFFYLQKINENSIYRANMLLCANSQPSQKGFELWLFMQMTTYLKTYIKFSCKSDYFNKQNVIPIRKSHCLLTSKLFGCRLKFEEFCNWFIQIITKTSTVR